MSEPTQPPSADDETISHQIRGWDRPAWALRGGKNRHELTWQREASVDVTYDDHGVEATFAPELVRVDQVVIDETQARVVVGQTVIQHADGCSITPGEGRKLAAALVELADYSDSAR